MKKWLSGIMLLMLCFIGTTKVVYADMIVGPSLGRGTVGFVSVLAILVVVAVIIAATWKIIQNMKKK